MGYIIVKGHNLVDLENQVKELIKNGWKPQGGIAIDSLYMYQAMAKVSKNKK